MEFAKEELDVICHALERYSLACEVCAWNEEENADYWSSRAVLCQELLEKLEK